MKRVFRMDLDGAAQTQRGLEPSSRIGRADRCSWRLCVLASKGFFPVSLGSGVMWRASHAVNQANSLPDRNDRNATPRPGPDETCRAPPPGIQEDTHDRCV